MRTPLPNFELLLRFRKQSEQRRPTKLVEAHYDFQETYEAICGPGTPKRPDYSSVLGFNEPKWSLPHEKKVVVVLLELASCNILPAEKLDLENLLISLPKLTFTEFLPPSSRSQAKRLRMFSASDEAELDAALEEVDDHMVTAKDNPRPAWAMGPFNLSSERDLGVAAVLEVILPRYKELSFRNASELHVWEVASKALAGCTFPSPLASFDNRDGLRVQDLREVVNHLDRCAHLAQQNTAASRNRAALLADLLASKLQYVRELEMLGVPPPVLAIFDPERTIADWFSKGDDLRGGEIEATSAFRGERGDDPLEYEEAAYAEHLLWLGARLKSWQAMALRKERPLAIRMQRRRLRSRQMHEVSPLPEARPWIERHPTNGTASLTDQGAAMLRLIRADCGVSKARQPVVLALMYVFFFQEEPPLDLLTSGPTIDLAERRLAARDKVVMIEEIAANLAKSPFAQYFSLFDDTHFKKGERHVYFVSYFDVEKGTPVEKLVSLKPTPGKDSVTNAKEDFINLQSIEAPVGKHGGTCSDHAALAEGRELGKLVIAAAATAAPRPHDLEVQANLGDEMHKAPLVWKVIDEGTFGPDNGGIQSPHHKQLLYQLWFMIEQDEGALSDEVGNYMGLKGKSENEKKPPRMCVTRWQLVGIAAESWLKRKEEIDCRGERAFPGLFRHMASREARGTVPHKGWMYLANHCMDPRLNAAIIWEAEHNQRWGSLCAWNRAESRQGFGPGFRIMDSIERLVYDDALWWQRVREDPKTAYPKTVAAIMAMDPKLSDQYLGFLEKGIAAGYQEHLKLYAYQSEPKFLVLHLFCCGKSGSCMRCIAAVLSERLPCFRDKGFMAPVVERADDRWYADKLSSQKAKDELVSFSHHWGLDNPDVLSDLVALSWNLADTRDGDTLTYEFVHGRAHKTLFSHFCFSLAALATTCVIVELLFSQMKNVQMANESSESVDQALMFIFNVLGDGRRLRRKMLAHTASGNRRHLHTKEQIAELCKQALVLLKRYSPEAMKGIRGRRSFGGSFQAADKTTARRGATVKNEKKNARKPSDPTPADWGASEAAARASPLAVQVEEMALLAIVPRQRIFAVVMEEKITGQVNSEAVFWSKIKGGVKGFLAEVRKVLPLVRGALGVLRGVQRLKDHAVGKVATRGPPQVLRLDPQGKGKWVPLAPELWGGPKTLKVHPAAQAQHGLLSVVGSLRRALLARESPLKHGSKAVVSEVPVVGGSIQRGFACPYCLREERKLQHWGSVACFLDLKDRRAVGVCVLMNTHAKSLLRMESWAAKTAAAREGREWAL